MKTLSRETKKVDSKISKAKCSFCQKTIEQFQVFVKSKHNDATICDACVKRAALLMVERYKKMFSVLTEG